MSDTCSMLRRSEPCTSHAGHTPGLRAAAARTSLHRRLQQGHPCEGLDEAQVRSRQRSVRRRGSHLHGAPAAAGRSGSCGRRVQAAVQAGGRPQRCRAQWCRHRAWKKRRSEVMTSQGPYWCKGAGPTASSSSTASGSHEVRMAHFPSYQQMTYAGMHDEKPVCLCCVCCNRPTSMSKHNHGGTPCTAAPCTLWPA